MHALAHQRVEVNGQCGHEGLALARGHLSDYAPMEHDSAHELHVEVPHGLRVLCVRGPDHPLARLAHHGKGFRQDLFQLAVRLLPRDVPPFEGVDKPVAELLRPATEGLIRQLLYGRLETVDLLDRIEHGLDHPLVP